MFICKNYKCEKIGHIRWKGMTEGHPFTHTYLNPKYFVIFLYYCWVVLVKNIKNLMFYVDYC